MRTIGLCFVAALLGSAPGGCGSGSAPKDFGFVGSSIKPPAGDKAAAPKADGEWAAGESKAAPAPTAPPATTPPPPPAMVDGAHTAVEKRPKRVPDAPAGVLTAGSFDDNAFPQFFRLFANKAGQNPHVGGIAGQFLGRRVEVVVRNGQGQPVGNARVRITAAGENAADLVTRSDGRAVFVATLDGMSGGSLTVTATAPGGPPVAQPMPADADRCEVVLPGASGTRPNNLDLAIVLDTTGSMGDELRFLQAEVKSLAAGIQAKFPNVSVRYGLVCYCDLGDEYVTRSFDFTPDAETFRRNLAAQTAGGGDTPEAMHRGLGDAVGLKWRTEGTARVLFLVADAPPHAADAPAAVGHVNALRRKGVAVYPVFASCNDKQASEAAELLMRGAAMATGSQYLFLTDDSGVGDAHGEPHIPYYRVERLNQLVARVIADELTGTRSEPDPQTVIRTVGQPPVRGR